MAIPSVSLEQTLVGNVGKDPGACLIGSTASLITLALTDPPLSKRHSFKAFEVNSDVSWCRRWVWLQPTD